MPQRLLRPGITTSRRFNALSLHAQSFYIRLLTVVDDYGRSEADHTLLASLCFPYDRAITCQQIADICQQMSAQGMAIFYEADGTKYVQLLRWKERVRSESRHPAPPADICQQSADKCQQMIASPPQPQPQPQPQPLAEPNGKCYPPAARVALSYLNEKSARSFRETAKNLDFITARLAEPGITIEGVLQMIDRQCNRWRNTDMAEYLRPETLFNATKFESYYAAKDVPIVQNGKAAHPWDGLNMQQADELWTKANPGQPKSKFLEAWYAYEDRE